MKSLLSVKDLSIPQIKKLLSLSFQLKFPVKNFSQEKSFQSISRFKKPLPKSLEKNSLEMNPKSALTGSHRKVMNQNLSQLKIKSLQHRLRSYFLDEFNSPPTMVHAYFEPSTRTKMSFEWAAKRLGLSVIYQNFTDSSSSRVKGESIIDTLKLIEIMNPDLLVIRYDGAKFVEKILKKFHFPCINAGGGSKEHPTQALLDLFTVLEARKFLNHQNQILSKELLKDERILFVGDIMHSRVAHSNQILFKRLGAKIGASTSRIFFTENKFWKKTLFFNSLEEGLKWATICIGLRWQKERHSQRLLKLSLKNSPHDPNLKSKRKTQNKKTENPKKKSQEKSVYTSYQLNKKRLSFFSKNGLILHPGPVIWNEELSEDIKEDSRLKIYDQVLNGMYVRMALIALILRSI